MKKILIGCLFFFCLASSAWSATYYVDHGAAGDDTANGTSTSTPWKHAPGMSGWTGSVTLANGDTVILKGGVTWTPASTTENLWIVPVVSSLTIQGGQQLGTPWGAGLPVLDGTGSTASRHALELGSMTGLTIDGVKIYNWESGTTDGDGIYLLGSMVNLEIKNSTFDLAGTGAITGAFSDGTDHVLLHNNTTSNSGRWFFGVADGDVANDIQIYDNIFLGPGTWCGGTAGSRCVGAGDPYACCVGANPGNQVANDAACNAHGDGIMMGSGCTGANTCLTNVKIFRNKFYGDWAQGVTAQVFLQNGGAPGGTQYGGNHAEIYDNQFSTDTDGSLSPGYISIWSLWNDIKVYNNTFGGYQGGTYPTSYCFISNQDATNIILKNNIFSGCTNAIGVSDATGATMTVDYNYYHNEVLRYISVGAADCRDIAECQSETTYEDHGAEGDPLFVTAPTGSNSGNLHLQVTSPAKTGGTNLGSPYTTDLDGVVGTGRIGAYEYEAPPAAAITIGVGGTVTTGIGGTITLTQ